MLNGKTTILPFLKAPRPATVKTRLAQSVGVDRATTAYRRLVERQLRALSSLGREFALEVHYAPANAETEMAEWLGSEVALLPQFEGDLGERLEHAVASAFQRGAAHVVCIGGDCPELDSTHCEKAARLLRSDVDVVIGPSEDGGYYLIATARFIPELFREIPWSASNTCQVTFEKATSLGLEVEFMETLYDVDTEAELHRAFESGLLKL